MQADDFFNAYLVLNGNNEALMERLHNNPGKPLIGTKELGTRVTGHVDIVCLAFSVELYIKDLLCMVKGKAPRGHNIFKLFEQLPEYIRKEIFSHESICQNPFITRGNEFSTKRFSSYFSAYDGFIEKIEEISKGFEKWRYSYEYAALRYDASFALVFIEAIKSAANKARKQIKK